MGDTWVEVGGLGTGDAQTGDKPRVALRHRDGAARLVQITFAAGQQMSEHTAPAPIMIIGQRGTVEVIVDGSTVTVQPGVALRIDTRIPHSLTATTDADVTLIVLG